MLLFFASHIAIISFLYLYMYFYCLAVNKSCSKQTFMLKRTITSCSLACPLFTDDKNFQLNARSVSCTDVKATFLCFMCIKRVFFLPVVYFLETCQIKPMCLSHITLLPAFIALFSCSLLHWVIILHVWYCGVILLRSRRRGYTNSINISNGTVLQKITDSDRRC